MTSIPDLSGKIINISLRYHEKLYSAREKGGKEPEIPALPEDMVKDVSSLYRTMYERITGKKW